MLCKYQTRKQKASFLYVFTLCPILYVSQLNPLFTLKNYSYSFSWKNPSSSSIDPSTKFFDLAISKQCPTTEPLSQSELIKLLESLVERHRVAYAWDAQLNVRKLIQHIGNQPVRTHIRAALEALDINYAYKEIITPEATNLVEGSVEEEEGFFKENEYE